LSSKGTGVYSDRKYGDMKRWYPRRTEWRRMTIEAARTLI